MMNTYLPLKPLKRYDAVIVGAGPAGLTCASILLDQGIGNICMIDPAFNAGRINEKYREVPSNTKVHIFVNWATSTETFSKIIDSTPKGNAFDRLMSLDQSKGCQLEDAIAVAKMLSDGLRNDSRVASITSSVRELVKQGDMWSLPHQGIMTDRVILAQGSHPRANPLLKDYPHMRPLDLDTALTPSVLDKEVRKRSKVAVIGSSHSAVLVLRNLLDLNQVSIVNFYRSPLLYAVYKDGWILHDNTGLKGAAADWAKKVLDVEELPSNLRRVNLKVHGRSEKQIYDAELKDCTHVVNAIGYDMNELPKVMIDGSEVQPEFDPWTGKFYIRHKNQEYLQSLYGVGIAFPERVIDLEGNVENAVGWFKFMKSVKKMAPQWLKQDAG